MYKDQVRTVVVGRGDQMAERCVLIGRAIGMNVKRKKNTRIIGRFCFRLFKREINCNFSKLALTRRWSLYLDTAPLASALDLTDEEED